MKTEVAGVFLRGMRELTLLRWRTAAWCCLLLGLAVDWEVVAAQSSDPFTSMLWVGDFSSTPSVRVLGNRVIAVDREAHGLVFVDATRLSRKPVSRGEGPQEVIGLRRIAAFRGDSSLLFGRDKLRAVVIDGQGRPARTISLHRLNSDSAFLYSFHGASTSGEMTYLSPRMERGKRDSADVMVIDPEQLRGARRSTVYFPPPAGVYRDQEPALAGSLVVREQVVMTDDGRLVIYRGASNTLEVVARNSLRLRRFTLPGSPRERTQAEKKMQERARTVARQRADSALAKVPPEMRPRLAAQLSSSLEEGLANELVPAYASDGLVVLSADIVAIRRGPPVPGRPEQYDWVELRSGRQGTFQHPPSVRLVGGGGGFAVFGRTTEEGFIQIASLRLSDLIDFRSSP